MICNKLAMDCLVIPTVNVCDIFKNLKTLVPNNYDNR